MCAHRSIIAGLIIWFISAATPSVTAGGGFPSDNVAFLSHLDLDDFSSAPSSGNDCWGYVAPSGREYALLGLRNAVAVVEVTNPSEPDIIAEIPHTSSNWCDIKVYQDYAYAVNEEAGGMDVIDLTQVDNGIATLVRRVTDAGLQTTHNLAVDTDSGFLYLCDANINGGRMVAFDLSNPSAPVIVGQIDSLQGADTHDAQIVTYTSGPNAGKQIAFASVGGTGIDIYDVTDKQNMFRLSRSTYPNLSFAHQCWTEDLQYLYVNDELDSINETVIFDITDLSNPILVGTYTAGLTAIDHNQYVHQGLIYESDYTAGLHIFDAADPVNPVRIGWFDTFPDSDAPFSSGTWSNYPFFPSGNILISTKDAGLFVVRLGPSPLLFEHPNGRPDMIHAGGDSFLVDITGQGGNTLNPVTPLLHYDAGAGLVEVPLTQVVGDIYAANFNPIQCPALVQYYFSAMTTSGITIKDPPTAPDDTYSAISGSAVTVSFHDDMETDLGWTIGALGDGASAGIWARVDPNGNGSAPERDHTPDPGAVCFVTGQDPPGAIEGANDVDDGTTTLTTPVFDLSGASDVIISYWRWYANDFFQPDGDEGNGPNEDVFTVDITSNGTDWINVETVGPTGPETSGGWFLHAFNVADFVTPTAQVQMRFVASDTGNLSVVEAGVDDVQVNIVACGQLDCNSNGIPDETDIANCSANDTACQDCNDNRVPDACEDPFPQQGRISLDRQTYACDTELAITVNDCGLNADPLLAESTSVVIQSDSEPAGEQLLLTETGLGTGVFQGAIRQSLINSSGVLLAGDGDTLTAAYTDADDGLGGANVTVTAQADMDCSPPVVSQVDAEVLGAFVAFVTFTTDEPATATLRYGLACNSLNLQAVETQFQTSFSFVLDDLTATSTYFFEIEFQDQLGNSATYDNGGTCYTFQTGEIPNYFTEHFENNDNDLDFRAILFTPDGSPDIYRPCTFPILDLPSDPTGGAVLNFPANNFAAVTLPQGMFVSLYGIPYDTFYVGAYGYVTFESGDNESFDTLDHHFDLPRISALFELIDPSAGGTVSWKSFQDRVTVTWQDVPSFFQQNSNTFQIDMFFDGRIRLSYANIDEDDGLAGLSDGRGVPPGFFETDLSALDDCGPQPPVANDVEIVTDVNTPIEIALPALDDGEPNPPGALDYTIKTLPTHGLLTDPNAGVIASTPYALVGSSGLVKYTPQPWFGGPDDFQFSASDGGTPPDGGESLTATVSLTVGSAEVIHAFMMDADPGWTTGGQWAFGKPLGGGSHDGDPPIGFTGINVYGYNLAADYSNNLPPTHLDTLGLDCRRSYKTKLRFQRWLGVESSTFDHAAVSISTDGISWATVWGHEGGTISDNTWVGQSFDISSVADGQPTVFIRWTMGPTDDFVTYPGWNIDDVEIHGVPILAPGDLDDTGQVDLDDWDIFTTCYAGPNSPISIGCERADMDLDGDADLHDAALIQREFE